MKLERTGIGAGKSAQNKNLRAKSIMTARNKSRGGMKKTKRENSGYILLFYSRVNNSLCQYVLLS
jgi:hypothetical protein